MHGPFGVLSRLYNYDNNILLYSCFQVRLYNYIIMIFQARLYNYDNNVLFYSCFQVV